MKDNANRKYITLGELSAESLKSAAKDPNWESVFAAANPEYIDGFIFNGSERNTPVRSCHFDVQVRVEAGSCEGYYADIVLARFPVLDDSLPWKCLRNSYERNGGRYTDIHLIMVKTLDEGAEGFMHISQLAALIAYHVTMYCNQNIQRFD